MCFFKKYAENEAGRPHPDHFLVFKKALALYEVKASGLQLSFNIFLTDLNS